MQPICRVERCDPIKSFGAYCCVKACIGVVSDGWVCSLKEGSNKMGWCSGNMSINKLPGITEVNGGKSHVVSLPVRRGRARLAMTTLLDDRDETSKQFQGQGNKCSTTIALHYRLGWRPSGYLFLSATMLSISFVTLTFPYTCLILLIAPSKVIV